MKQLLKNKKVIVAFALALVFMIGGATYARFTVKGVPAGANIQAGRLRTPSYRFIEWIEQDDDGNDVGAIRIYYDKDGNVLEGISGTLDPAKEYIWRETWLDPAKLFEPSIGGTIGIELRNPNPDGLAIPATVKVDNVLNKIVIWSALDDLGNAVPLDQGITFDSMAALAAAYPDDVAVTDFQYSLREDDLQDKVFYIGGEYVGMLAWLYDATIYDATGEYVYYVSLSALPKGYDLIVDFISDVQLAPEAGNIFQGCVADISFSHTATQVFVDACKAMWGNGIDLQMLNGSGTPTRVDLNAGKVSASRFSIETFAGPHIASAEARRMTSQDLAKIFFPELFN